MPPASRLPISRWILSFIGVAILAAILWFFGPFWHPLAAIWLRALIIVLLIALWLLGNVWLHRKHAQREISLEQGIVPAAPGHSQTDEIAAQDAAMAQKLKTALALLRQARGARGFLYDQPWYVLIGPPGAGKTTALMNAGLKFPLAAELGQTAIAGTGGTRLCDWWFTDEAVLIDTAGRYTTQDSAQAVDQAGWLGFLDLLKKSRPRQPLNGVIVAIAIADIAGAPPDERAAHARAIRQRVKEITARLGVRVPVYALLTKADLIAGFMEFHDDLDTAGRNQVWGITFRDAAAPQGQLSSFSAEFALLVGRIQARLIDRLQAERNPDRRSLIAGFPTQIASLEQPIDAFLQDAFGGSTLDPAPWLRGVYLISGTQEGTPIDRLTGMLAGAFGIDQRQIPSLHPQLGRSYFLARLLREVIFGEAMLGGAGQVVARRRLAWRIGGFTAIGLAFIALLTGLLISRNNNATALAAMTGSLAQEQKTAAALPLNPVARPNLPIILPMLDQARRIDHMRFASGFEGLGLEQSFGLREAGHTIYRNALNHALLPRLILQLEAEMRGGLNRPDYLYQATRVYLMLGNQGPLEPALVEAWMRLDWQRLYPGLANTDLRARLMRHLEALLARPLSNVPLDGALVATARATFSRVPIAERVYSRIRDSAAASSLPAWTPAAALGEAGIPFFQLGSAMPLSEGIPGFYTVKGFYAVLLPALGHASRDVAQESWVLGRQAQVRPDSPAMQSLESDVIRLYQHDYVAKWAAMLDDLDLAPLGNIGQTVQALYVLGSPRSPMQRLLVSISRQLTLSAPPAALRADHPLQGKDEAAINAAAAKLKGIISKAGTGTSFSSGRVDQDFASLRDYVGNGGSGTQLSLTLHLINKVQRQLAALASSAPGAAEVAPNTGGDPAALLAGEAIHDPKPVQQWLRAIVSTADAERGGSAATATAAAFQAPGGPAQFCSQAVAHHYPFDPASAQGTPLADFARLFAPGGLLETFFNTQIRPFVNMTSGNWRVQAVNGVAPPLSQKAVSQFQRAQVIRQIFFTTGSTMPEVQFTITPISLSAGVSQASLQLGQLTIPFGHGEQVPTEVIWPGAGGTLTARLNMTPAQGGSPLILKASGPWALFRLFNQGHLTKSGSASRYLLSFEQNGAIASFSIEAGSVFNPFVTKVLQDFRCPSLAR
jgi:type VI secretion system protein ImpL